MWFWNLEEAKKRVLIDKCKQIKNCTDVTDPEFADCGFCTEKPGGIPVKKVLDSNGQTYGVAMYPDDYRDNNGKLIYTNCSSASIIVGENAGKCITSGATNQTGGSNNRNDDGSAPIVPGTSAQVNELCTPNDSGLLSVPCLRDSLISSGCSNDGAISIALSENTSLNPMSSVESLDSAQLYNQRANDDTRFNYNMFKDGKATQRMAIQEFSKIQRAAQNNPPTSAIGAAARDLCLNKGDIAQFDFCSEIQPSATIAEGMIPCLRREWKKRYGTEKGKRYPSQNTLAFYRSLGTYGGALNYMDGLVIKAQRKASRSSDNFEDIGTAVENIYNDQRQALNDLRGIVPDLIPERAPEVKGIELFWYSGAILVANNTMPAIPYLENGATIPIVSGYPSDKQSVVSTNIPATGMIAITDVRVGTPTAGKIYIAQPGYFPSTDNGFTNNNYALSLNKALPDATMETINTTDQFSMLGRNNTSPLIATQPWTFSPASLNLLKLRWNLRIIDPTNATNRQRLYLSQQPVINGIGQAITPIETGTLTREKEGPFLMYELNGNEFADLRCPEQFTATLLQTEAKTRDTISPTIPGTRGYLQLLNSRSYCTIANMSFSAWTTTTFVFRIPADFPVTSTRENATQHSIFTFSSDTQGSPPVSLNIKVTRVGNTAAMTAMFLKGSSGIAGTGMPIVNLATWYICVVNRIADNPTWTISFYDLNQAITKTAMNPKQSITINTLNAFTSNPVGNSRLVMGQSSAAGFSIDLAWWHFFNTNQFVSAEFLQREAQNNWKITTQEE